MIKFLIRRPIAVLMAFTACFIIGLVTYSTLSVSLLPNIAIPEITVQVSAANTSARELENTIVKPLRSQLIQVSTLKDIHSESRDGAGIIRLSFEFGTNTFVALTNVCLIINKLQTNNKGIGNGLETTYLHHFA